MPTQKPSWQRACDEQLHQLAGLLPAALGGDPSGVHRARIASRRAREQVAILADVLPRRSADMLMRRLRRITRRLGRARELDVGLTLLDELGGEHPPLTSGLLALKASMAAERLARVTEAARAVAAGGVAKLRRRLDRALKSRSRGWNWRAAATAHLERRGRRLLKRLETAGAVYDPAELHAARIAVKRFRYALEIVAEVGRRPAKRALVRLKRAQDTLGHLHDLQVLARHVQSDEQSPASQRKAVLELLDRQIRTSHAAYLAQREMLRKVVDGQLDRGRGPRTLTTRARPAAPRSFAR